MTAPRVSVVMPVYNAPRFLEEAVASVFAQTLSEWELLIVDDGSTDESPALARALAARDPARVRCLQHPGGVNRGLSASRNLGVRHASGEFIAFLDADDVYLPEKLERQVAILDAYPEAAMTYGPTLHWYGWTGDPADRARDVHRRLGVPPDTLVPPRRLIPSLLRLTAQTPGTCGVLIRRSVHNAIGGSDERFRGMFEDQVLIYKIMLRWPVFVSGEGWDLYRQHPASLSRWTRARGLSTSGSSPIYGEFLEWLAAYLPAQGITDPEIDAALAEQLRPFRGLVRPHWTRLAFTLRRFRHWLGRVRRGEALDRTAR